MSVAFDSLWLLVLCSGAADHHIQVFSLSFLAISHFRGLLLHKKVITERQLKVGLTLPAIATMLALFVEGLSQQSCLVFLSF